MTRRKYVYRLEAKIPSGENTDDAESISVFFHKEGKNDMVGGLFVEMGALSVEEEGSETTMVTTNKQRHLCGEDLYTASWRFGRGMLSNVDGIGERWWEIRYDVVGPKKNYISETRYSTA